MNDEKLKQMVDEVIGNNDPYWNEPVLNVVKQIIELPFGSEASIIGLLGEDRQYTDKQLKDIFLSVNMVCRKLNIALDFSRDNAKVDGVLYALPFRKKEK